MDTRASERRLFGQNVPSLKVLALAELEFLNLERFAFLADDSLGASIALANRLLEVLVALNNGNHARLLHLAVEAAEQVLGRLLGVFLGNLYHIRNILPKQR